MELLVFIFYSNIFLFGECSNINDIKNFDVNKFVKEYHFENDKYSFYFDKMKEIIFSCLNFNIYQRGKNLNK